MTLSLPPFVCVESPSALRIRPIPRRPGSTLARLFLDSSRVPSGLLRSAAHDPHSPASWSTSEDDHAWPQPPSRRSAVCRGPELFGPS
ncbi:hypothetical protein VTK73DRAFT_5822 [Phialemonium thermophilum]|uniref:Uncharacterized protein n=1 Tax=Phialemonium thermophilum TaxID=223376 RepID=A0ABR3V200_9PEZI